MAVVSATVGAVGAMGAAGAAAVGAAGAVAGGAMAARGAKKAARTQADAAREAGNLQDAQYQQNRQDMLDKQAAISAGVDKILPQYDANIAMGRQADARTQALSGALGPQAQAKAFQEYQMSPGQQWKMDQGVHLTEQDLAAAGLGGGTRYKTLARYKQGLVDQNFADDYNRLAAQGDMGRGERDSQTKLKLGVLQGDLTNAQNLATMGTQSAATQAGVLNDIGAAQAGAQIAKSRAIGGAIQGVGSAIGTGLANYQSPIKTPTIYQNGLPQSSGTGGFAPNVPFWQ